MLSFRYNGLEGTHIKVTEFVRDTDCLVCGPGTLIELDTSSTLSEVSNIIKLKSIACPVHIPSYNEVTLACEGLRC
jgi:hypothetical protein